MFAGTYRIVQCIFPLAYTPLKRGSESKKNVKCNLKNPRCSYAVFSVFTFYFGLLAFYENMTSQFVPGVSIIRNVFEKKKHTKLGGIQCSNVILAHEVKKFYK